jgi:4-hydroxybenzoate polyprenyltransferase
MPRWPETKAHFLALLALGRVSHLPTVWSNCLAAWLLGGGGSTSRLGWVCLGATFLFMGGAFLNDAFDADFDRQHRAHRPIPSGVIRIEAVWWWATVWLCGGTTVLIFLGGTTSVLALLLLGGIVLYDAVNKMTALSPFILGACRALLYTAAAGAARDGVSGLAIWSGLALGAYVAGLTALVRSEAMKTPVDRWPILLLFVPVGLALLVNNGDYRWRGLGLGLVVCVWTLRCLRFSWRRPDPNLVQTVDGLISGIVLVDWLAVAGGDQFAGLTLLILFGITRGVSPHYL